MLLSPSMKLVNAKEDCSETIKVVWASQVFGVDLSLQKQKQKQQGELLPVALVVVGSDDNMVGPGDGNALGQALYRLSGQSAGGMSLTMDAVMDDWCEWEREILRPWSIGHNQEQKQKQKQNQQASKILDRLNGALENSPQYIVGNSMSMADIAIVTTLMTTTTTMTTTQLPERIAHYVALHSDAWESAKAQVAADLAKATATTDDDYTNNSSIAYVLEAVFTTALKLAFGDDVDPPSKNWVKKCADAKHGDYQCTAAMPLFSALKKAGNLPEGIKSASDVALALVKAVGSDHPVVMELEVTKIGFICCRLTPTFLQFHINKFLKEGKLPRPSTVTPTTCLVDFSSPNIAKEMHVGHLRSTIIGESVSRILEFVGHKVHRVNHVGDWGTQFGMLIEYLKIEYPDFANSMPNITDLTQFYKNAKQRFDDDADFKKISQLNVVKLQSGDAECLKIWHILCDVSRKEFQKVYDRLDITVHEFGESFYNDKIPPVIEEFEKAGLIRIEEGGAKCVFVDKFKVPLMLQKSDGGYGYDSTDMAALKHRIQTLGAERIIVITDFTQADHFKMCYSAAKSIGWVSDNVKLEHIGFGTVQGEDGKRFKTRSGDTVRLVDLLDEAVGRMDASLRERMAENKANISEEEVPMVAEAIGYSAVKYFDLRRNPTTNYKFSYDQMLDTKGNTAVYLLYAHARLESIISKAKEDFNVDVHELVAKNTEIVITHDSERNLALHLQGFTDTILTTLDDMFPYHICDFVYNLSNASSDFVTQCKVLGSPEMESRLLLCLATTMAMRECFHLVGMRHVKSI